MQDINKIIKKIEIKNDNHQIDVIIDTCGSGQCR